MTSAESRVGFLRSGVTLAALKADGTQPEVTDVLMMEVMKGSRSGVMVWKIGDGRGSRGQVVGLEEVTSFRTSSGERGEKEDRQDTFGIAMGELDAVLWGRWEKELLMSVTFFSKYVTKESAERDEGGVGGGGLRRVEKVENSFLGLEVQDWILLW